MQYALAKPLSVIICFFDMKNLSKTLVQLSQFYHCDFLELYNTPIIQIFDLVEIINNGVK